MYVNIHISMISSFKYLLTSSISFLLLLKLFQIQTDQKFTKIELIKIHLTYDCLYTSVIVFFVVLAHHRLYVNIIFFPLITVACSRYEYRYCTYQRKRHDEQQMKIRISFIPSELFQLSLRRNVKRFCGAFLVYFKTISYSILINTYMFPLLINMSKK